MKTKTPPKDTKGSQAHGYIQREREVAAQPTGREFHGDPPPCALPGELTGG